MTDHRAQHGAASRTIDYYSEAAQARVKRRYRSEARFRAIGLGAVCLAGLFVAIVLADIVRKGLPAFSEHRAILTLSLDAADIDPKGARDINDIRAADYAKLTREALRAQFPEVRDRRGRRLLDGILSTGAPDDIRTTILADPGLIGTSKPFPLLLSDDADLFLKGVGASQRIWPGQGEINLSVAGADVTISSASGVFSGVLAALKADAMVRVGALERELARLPGGIGINPALDTKRNELTAEITSLRLKASNSSASEILDSSLPSLILEANGRMIKLSEIKPDQATGTALVALAAGTPDKGNQWRIVQYLTPEANRRFSDAEIAWLQTLRSKGKIEQGFAWRFFTNGDSREPELAGIRGALIGSALTLLVTLGLCLPIGVAAAVYLEEFAPRNRFTDILEVNINNLAAVPSIVFGLLGLAMFLNFFGLPRSAPLVGGLVLALLVLPTIIIAARAALKAVPPSIKEAALGVGASHQQAIFHHVLPLAMPGIMTGTIIGMAHALGETAPLLMIGMVAFIVDIPKSITDSATVLPVQIFLWADLPELAFQARTAAAILVLLAFLFLMNGLAIILRRRFERRW